MRVLYAAGPGDVLGTYRQWRKGEDDASQVSMTYSGQFFDAIDKLDAEALIVAWKPGCVDRIDDGRFTLINRPAAWADRRGLYWHLGQVWYGLWMIAKAIHFRPHVFVTSGGTHWFMLRCLTLLGARVVPTLHCVLWPKYRTLGRFWRIIHRLDRGLFRRGAFAILSASHDITQQVAQLTAGSHAPVIEFLPTYRPALFEPIPAPDRSTGLFRVLYAGRIEGNKGVFDLLWMSNRLRKVGRREIIFDICGDGSARSELEDRVEADGLTDAFHLHGHCDRTTMQRILGESHLLVVPTRTDFVEGFNQVVVEGVLAGRPVITSTVCPAVEYVADAVVCVEPDDRQAYLDQLLRLCDDRQAYERLYRSTEHLRKQFLDDSKSWCTAMSQVLNAVRNQGRPLQRLIDIPHPTNPARNYISGEQLTYPPEVAI